MWGNEKISDRGGRRNRKRDGEMEAGKGGRRGLEVYTGKMKRGWSKRQREREEGMIEKQEGGCRAEEEAADL